MSEDYTIAEDFRLPSEGLIYTGKQVNPVVKLRSMTTRDEMKRLSPTETPYKTLANLIESCMVEKPAVSVYDMALGDYEYLLHKLRIVTYGPTYKTSYACPVCGQITNYDLDLDTLSVIEFDIDKFNEASTVTLPRSKKVITLRYQTPRMLDEIDLKTKDFKRKNKNIDFDPSLKITLKMLIETVDGKTLDQTALDSFIDNLPAADANFLMQKSAILNNMVGLDTEINVTCSKCGEDITTFFRFGPEFFRPTIS